MPPVRKDASTAAGLLWSRSCGRPSSKLLGTCKPFAYYRYHMCICHPKLQHSYCCPPYAPDGPSCWARAHETLGSKSTVSDRCDLFRWMESVLLSCQLSVGNVRAYQIAMWNPARGCVARAAPVGDTPWPSAAGSRVLPAFSMGRLCAGHHAVVLHGRVVSCHVEVPQSSSPTADRRGCLWWRQVARHGSQSDSTSWYHD